MNNIKQKIELVTPPCNVSSDLSKSNQVCKFVYRLHIEYVYICIYVYRYVNTDCLISYIDYIYIEAIYSVYMYSICILF